MRAFDVLIVGGSYAGLSAALILGRCRRKVLVCDDGRPRNKPARRMHGFLSREDSEPSKILEVSRRQLCKFDNVEIRACRIQSIQRDGLNFTAWEQGSTAPVRSRIVLLATGVEDELPSVPGIKDFYGISVHHCPYCDGWEHRDKTIGLLGSADSVVGLAEELTVHSSSLIYFAHGRDVLSQSRDSLTELGVSVESDEVLKLEGESGKVRSVYLVTGRSVPCEAIFFAAEQRQRSGLARQLDIGVNDDNLLESVEGTCPGVEGVFTAGNTSDGLQLAIVAAAEGARAAHEINTLLIDRDRAQYRERAG